MKMLIPALALLSTTAMAADLKWGVEGRFDYGNSTVKHEYATATNNYEEKRSEFYSGIIRLNATAVINDNLSARFRYRLSSEQAAATKQRDLSFGNVDFFYVDHKNEWFTSRIGKSNNSEVVGRENFVSGTDYNTTAYNSTSPATGYTPSNSAVYNMISSDMGLYHVGYSAIYTGLEGQTFTLSAFNPQKSTTYTDAAGTGDDAKNSKMGLGAYYNGKFMDGLVQPTLGFTTVGVPANTDGTTTPSANNKVMAAGIRSAVAGFVIDADWKQYKRQNTVNNATTATNKEDKTTSVYANVAYTWDMLTPFVNYINDKFAPVGTNFDSYKRSAFTVGLQIKPYKDNNFRYHVAYTNDVKKVTLGTTTATAAALQENKVKSNQVVAGIKFDI